jgi:chromate transport protein ChrA
MDGNKKGVSVKEIEEFTKKHRYEVFFCALFVLTCIFSIFGHFGGNWSVFFAMGGAVLSIIFPTKTESLLRMVFKFIFKQDKTIQIVLGAVSLILAIFLPFVIFLVIGLIGGRMMNIMAGDSSK